MAAACMVTRQGGESGVTAGLSAGADNGWDAEASERVAPIEKQRRFIIGFRIVEFTPKPEMKDDIVNFFCREVLPILKKQQGFMEFLPLVPETKTEKWIVTLWAEKRDADRWVREGYPKGGRNP
jgi:heme-degrading monooxygenase HmoA